MLRALLRPLSLLAALALLLGGPAAGADEAAPEAHVDVVGGGVRRVFIPAPGAPMTAFVALVGTGAAYDPPGKSGAAHVVEHLLFNGTSGMTQEELYAAFDALGAYVNAATRQDYTMFQVLVPQQHEHEALALLGAMLFDSTIPPEIFQKEQGVVLEELRGGSSHAEETNRALEAAFMQGTPYANPLGGTEAGVEALTRDDALAFYQRGYAPGNVTLVIMSGLPYEEYEDISLFAPPGRGEHAPQPPPAAPVWTPEGVWRTAPAEDGRWRLVVRYPAPPPADPDYPAAVLLTTALDQHVLEMPDLPALPELGATLDVRRGFTHLVFDVPHEAADPLEALTAWRRSARRLADTIPADLDLTPARTHLAFEDASLRDRPHYYGFFRGPEFMLSPRPAVIDLPGAVATVRLPDVRRVARRILTGPHAAVVLVPDGEAADLTAPPLETRERAPYPPEPAPPAAEADHVERLPDGVALQLRHEPGLPLSAVHVLVDGRCAREPTGECGIVELAHRSLLGGTATRSEIELHAALTAMGAQVKTYDSPAIPYDDYSLSPAYSYVRAEALTERLPDLLAFLADVLRHASYPEEVVDREREVLVNDLTRDEPGATSGARLLYEALLGDGPWTCPPRGAPDDVARLTAADLRAFHPEYFRPDHLRVTVVSGLPLTRLRDLAVALFGGWEAPPGPRAAEPAPFVAPTPERRTIDRTIGGRQATLLVGQTLSVTPAERAAATLATSLLSARIAQVLREERGWAYSVGCGIEWDTPVPVWYARFDGGAENLNAAQAVIRKEVQRLQAGDVDADELRVTANRLNGRQMMRRLSAINRAYYWAMAARLPGGANGGHAPDYTAVPREAVVAFAHEHLDAAQWVRVRLRPDA